MYKPLFIIPFSLRVWQICIFVVGLAFGHLSDSVQRPTDAITYEKTTQPSGFPQYILQLKE